MDSYVVRDLCRYEEVKDLEIERYFLTVLRDQVQSPWSLSSVRERRGTRVRDGHVIVLLRFSFL